MTLIRTRRWVGEHPVWVLGLVTGLWLLANVLAQWPLAAWVDRGGGLEELSAYRICRYQMWLTALGTLAYTYAVVIVRLLARRLASPARDYSPR